MTAVRRSKGPRPGRTDGERASGKTTKILSRWSGGYRDKYGCTRKGGGGGGQKRDGHRKNREGTRAIIEADTLPGQRLATRLETHDHCGGRRLPRAPQELRGNLRVRGRHATLATPGDETRRENQDHCRGRRLLSPSTNTRAKYRQPHRSGGGTPHNHRDTGKDNRSSMAPGASQFGRTAGENRRYWGG